jgi:hypothetical protein
MLHLDPVLLRAIAQPPLDGVVELLDGANHPSPAPGVPRFLGFGHVGHVAPFLTHGSSSVDDDSSMERRRLLH